MQGDLSKTHRIWCAVPVFNNKDTVKDVVSGCLSVLKNVVVVDDGSTDTDLASSLSGMDVVVLRHENNLGKGQAILTAARYIEEHGGQFMITIDADGQHKPEDMEKFIPLLDDNGPSIIVGSRNFDTANVPEKSRFGRRFANFWLRIETGVYIDDCQSGFRAYPVRYLNRMKFRGSRYDFEAEVLARAVWAGLQLKTVAIDVFYPEPERRVSSFRPFLDNLRITHTHALLVLRGLLPFWGHRRLVRSQGAGYEVLRHPWKFFKTLLTESSTPRELAMAAAIGAFFAILPLLFVHTVVILFIAARLNLNKVVAVNVQHLFMPPVVPAMCIEVGFFLRHGYWFTDLSFETVFAQFSDRLLEWFLGSLIIAPLGALITGGAVFSVAAMIKKQLAPR
ncbi:MAG: DUF2062 domain-containing protein [Nitrospiraceae bacterium]|nr:MAG: DUF2062 domain-containing protein [Nitrospiraceae bacterium]